MHFRNTRHTVPPSCPRRRQRSKLQLRLQTFPAPHDRALSSVHSKPSTGSSEIRTLNFLLFSFFGGRKNLPKGSFLLSLKMWQVEPREALWVSPEERQPLQPKEIALRGVFFRMTHAIFFLSLCDSDSHFTQTFACVFFPLPWLLASRLCTQCFPTPSPQSESAWWKH